MAYIDYSDYIYYSNSFGGGTIPETSFNMYERRARAFIDYITFNRLKNNNELIDEDIKGCICEIMECNYKTDMDGGIKASESIGNVSVSYVVGPNTTDYGKYYKIAKMYLGHTNLLYRGV